MLTRLVIRNFKQFAEVDIELGPAVVFIGPNNAGKTSALQALALNAHFLARLLPDAVVVGQVSDCARPWSEGRPCNRPLRLFGQQ